MPLSLTPTRAGVLMALGAIVGWSFNFIFSRSVAGIFPPFTFAFMRITVALIVFAPFAGRDFLRCWPIFLNRPFFYIFLALTGLGYFNPLIYISGQTTTAINMALLALASPIFTLILSRVFLGDAFTPRRLSGLFAAISGVVLLTTRGDVALLLELNFHIGDLIMIFASFIFACYSVSLRYIDERVSSNAFIFFLVAASFLFLLPPAAWEMSQGLQAQFTPVTITGIVYLGIVATILCYIGWNGAIARLGPGNTALLYYTMPLFIGFEAVLLLGEPLRWFHFVSGMLIIAGVLVATQKQVGDRTTKTAA